MRTIKNQRQLEYEESLFKGSDPLFYLARQHAQELGLLGISISFSEASLVRMVVQLANCKKFIEIGTLTGFSALAILEALSENGQLWTFEKNPQHAKMAKEILQQAADKSGKTVSVIEGDAEIKLNSIVSEGPFDGIFIDGNKSAYLKYLNWAEVNIKKGGLIIADNVFLEGGVWGDPAEKFKNNQIEVMKEFNHQLSDKSKYIFSLVPTSEGLIIAKKRD